MTTTKYVCLEAGCDFLSEDESAAREYIEKHPDHQVVEVTAANSSVICNPVGDTGEELSNEELPEEEVMTEEEEEE